MNQDLENWPQRVADHLQMDPLQYPVFYTGLQHQNPKSAWSHDVSSKKKDDYQQQVFQLPEVLEFSKYQNDLVYTKQASRGMDSRRGGTASRYVSHRTLLECRSHTCKDVETKQLRVALVLFW